jgi:hypothetical protein
MSMPSSTNTIAAAAATAASHRRKPDRPDGGKARRNAAE